MNNGMMCPPCAAAAAIGDLDDLTTTDKSNLVAAINEIDAGGGGGGGAPTDASYVTLGTNATLTNERVLAVTAGNLTLTDGGAGSTVTLDVGDFILNSAINSLYAAYVAGNTGAL